MRRYIQLTVLGALLAGCGVDGPPVPPPAKPEETKAGVTMTGTVKIGVAGRN